jgi:hypothetical protein
LNVTCQRRDADVADNLVDHAEVTDLRLGERVADGAGDPC